MDVQVEVDIDDGIVDVYSDIAAATKKYLTKKIKRKNKIPREYKLSLMSHIDSATIIYHGIDDNEYLKYNFGMALRALNLQLFRLERYEFCTQRMNPAKEAKIEAYSDPSVAAYAELTRGGLKTRNKYYAR